MPEFVHSIRKRNHKRGNRIRAALEIAQPAGEATGNDEVATAPLSRFS